MSNHVIVRSGSCFSDERDTRSAFRYHFGTGIRYVNVGFRLALDGTKKSPAPESGRGKP